MQNIFIALGDPVTAAGIQKILIGLAVPAILDGMQLTAPAADQIAVAPGKALTDSGVMISEDEVKLLQFVQTVQPANYTVYYSYTPSQNFGGNPAVLTVAPGLIPSSSFQNGVLLGWIKYPGASVPLSSSMFVSAKRIKLDESPEQQSNVFTTRYAPFSFSLTRTAVSGPFPVFSETYDGSTFSPRTILQNTGGSLSNCTYILPFQISPFGLGKITISVAVSAQASLTVNIQKTDGTVIAPIETNFYTNQPMDDFILSFDQANNFTPGEVCYIQFVMAIQPGNSVTFKALGTSADTEPF